MGKHVQLERQDSSFQFQSNHQGCLWAVLHILNYHQWHILKKMLPLKNHGRSTRLKGHGTSKTVVKDDDIVEMPGYFNEEAQSLLVERQSTDTVRPKRKSKKSQTRVLTAKVMTDRDPTQQSGQKISNYSPECKKGAMKSVQYFEKDSGKLEKQDLMREPADILEMFRLNKKIFAEMLRGEDVDPNKLFRKTKVGLTKSMSFPAIDSSRIRFHTPTKLEHKQNEYFPKAVSTQNHDKKTIPDKSDGSPLDFKHQGWNQLVVNRFNSIKQKVKQAFKEKRKDSTWLSVKPESSSPTIDSGIEHSSDDRKKIPESLDHLLMAQDDVNHNYAKRISFSNESLERYKLLFARSFDGQAKYRHCRSLNLSSGNKIMKNRLASRSFKRNLSSPDLELFCSFFHDPSNDSSQTEKPIINSVNQLKILDAELELDSRGDVDHGEDITLDEQDGFIEYESTSVMLEKNHSQKLVSQCNLNDEMEFSQSNQILDLETCFPDHLTTSPELPISEGKSHTSNGQPHSLSSDSVAAYSANYYCVRNILELSGLIECELSGTCQSFSGSKTSFSDELEGRGKEACTELDQQLLLDLVNEAVLNISETSSTYFHKAFSFSCHILPPPSGKRLVQAVWKRVGRHLSAGRELQLGQSLEDVMAGDLSKDDGWMKLQLEAEFVALDLEDLILDQLLDELICS